MRTLVVGAGPTGLFTAIALARRGREVTVVDRDPGPPAHGDWRRRGVMQFHHAHSFRGHVVDALTAEMPDVLDGLVAAGATIARTPDGRAATLHCRRMLFERELRACAAREPRIELVTGHVDGVISERGRVAGVRVGGSRVAADLVIDASGRASRVVRALRDRGEGSECGATYAGRQYRLRAGADPGPTNSVIGLSLSFAEYGAVVFLHDNHTFTVTLIHSDDGWRRLRFDAVFEAAVRSIPAVAEWIDPRRSLPMAPVLPGGRLYNRYRGQLDDAGQPVLPGLVSVGDAVCTTTPLAGRGVTLALWQARELVRLVDQGTHDIIGLTTEFDDWCTHNIRPWFLDHQYADAERVRRWSGGDIDLNRPLPSDLIVAAAAADQRLNDAVGPYVTMDALPDSLTAVQRRAREIYASGWRPTPAAGPTREELIAVVSTTPAVA